MDPQQVIFLGVESGAELGKALVGMIHGHSGLGHLLLVVSLFNIALVLSVSRNPQTLAKILKWGHSIYLLGGRANVLLGFTLLAMNPGSRPNTLIAYWWIVLSVLAWGGAEVVAKRMIKTDISGVQEGLPVSKNMTVGFVIELVILVIIFACMHMRNA